MEAQNSNHKLLQAIYAQVSSKNFDFNYISQQFMFISEKRKGNLLSPALTTGR